MPTKIMNLKFIEIKSRDNQKLKLARLVRDGRVGDKIFVEGLRLGEELLKTGLSINSIFFTAKFASSPRGFELLQKLSAKRLELFELDEKLFGSLSDTTQSQGVVIIAEKPQTGKEIIEKAFENTDINPLFLLLHQINNPANLGAILRTAEAVGVGGIITTKNTTDIFSAKSLRGAMGASFRLPLWINADFFDVLNWARLNKIRSVCADVSSSNSYLEIDWTISRLLVLGSEGHGLSEIERLATDENLIIPMENAVESLNVAVAGGVILFEAKRQRNQ